MKKKEREYSWQATFLFVLLAIFVFVLGSVFGSSNCYGQVKPSPSPTTIATHTSTTSCSSYCLEYNGVQYCYAPYYNLLPSPTPVFSSSGGGDVILMPGVWKVEQNTPSPSPSPTPAFCGEGKTYCVVGAGEETEVFAVTNGNRIPLHCKPCP